MQTSSSAYRILLSMSACCVCALVALAFVIVLKRCVYINSRKEINREMVSIDLPV